MPHTQLPAVEVRTRPHAKKPSSFAGALARGPRRNIVRVLPQKQLPVAPVLTEVQDTALNYVQSNDKFTLAATLATFGEFDNVGVRAPLP